GGCSADSDLCGPGSRQSAVLVRLPSAVPGLTTAQVGSVGPAAGTLRFNMSLVPEALNDGCPAARVVNHPVFRDVLDMANATGGETADRTFLSRCGAAGSVDLGASPHSVWYLYRAARAGPVAIDTRGTTTAIVVAVFNETPAGCGRLGSRAGCAANRPVVFDAVAGRSYRILVVTPTAVPPDVLVFRLTGPNTPPVATAAATARIAPGTRGALDARRSRDPDGDPLTFAWTQTAGPPVVLSDPGAASVGFTAPVVRTNTTLRFQVSVGDGAATSVATASVLVDVSLDDPDRDGVPAARDRCRGTPPGAPVDADGCSCSDTGHADCAALGTPCTPGSCDPATGACVVAPAPRGAPCTEDGDLCTDDVCDGAGSCGHLPVDCARACRDDGCDPTTGACVGSPLAPGTRCADDGNPCTDDVCDGTGTCRHDAVDSFPGATCRLDDLAGTFAAA